MPRRPSRTKVRPRGSDRACACETFQCSQGVYRSRVGRDERILALRCRAVADSEANVSELADRLARRYHHKPYNYSVPVLYLSTLPGIKLGYR
jgi:hypothetical protein